MPPPPRAKTALDAMKDIGFSRRVAAHVLKKLLDVYDNKYEYIEENGYQVLIVKILEEQELQADGGQEQDAMTGTHPEPSRKRLRKLSELEPSSSDSPGVALLKKPKLEPDVSPELDPGLRRRSELVSEQVSDEGKMVEPVLSPTAFGGIATENLEENTDGDETLLTSQEVKTAGAISQPSPSRERPEHASSLVNQRETRASSCALKLSVPQENAISSSHLSCSRDKLPDGCPPHNLSSAGNKAHEYQRSKNGSSTRGLSIVQLNTSEPSAVEKNADKGKEKVGISGIALENGTTPEPVTSRGTSTSDIDIASSDAGEVKLKLCFNSDRPDLRMPSLDSIVKMVEGRCLRSYKVLQPDLSLMKIMRDICQCAMELSTEATDRKQGNILQ